MNDQSSTWRQATLPGFAVVTGSPALAGGPRPCASQPGQTQSHVGPAAHPASRSAQLGSEKEQLMTDTSGQKCSGSSENAGHQSFSGNKSRRLTDENGYQQVLRTCKKCATEKPLSMFYANSKGSHRWTCAECEAEKARERKRLNKDAVSASHRNWRNRKRGYALVNTAKYRAAQRGLPFDLDPKEIHARIEAGRCEMTGIPFDLTEPRAWNAPSLDQIVPGAGYLMNNVLVVLYSLNVMANTWGPDRIIEIASAISERRRATSDCLQSLAGKIARQRLPEGDSGLYSLTWKERATPSGRLISQLVASAHRTSGKGASSPPSICDLPLTGWNTARATDGSNGGPNQSGGALPADAALAGWPTASASDTRQYSDAAITDWLTGQTTNGHGMDLNLAAQIATGPARLTASGEMLTGCSAGMASGGQLAPEFSLWLMGYQAAWASCGERAMQSCRRQRRKPSPSPETP